MDWLFGFYIQFDGPCFVLPRNFYNPLKFVNLKFEEFIFSKLLPSNLSPKSPVDFALLHDCIDNHNDLRSRWDKHIPKVAKRKKEDEETISSEFEEERDNSSVESNHDQVEFEFDKSKVKD
jgi:hypothetical protein